jgi:general secretion pathway protein J
MRPVNQSRRSGFTLVEILVAIAIFGLVMAAIYSGWMSIIRASRVGLEAAAQAQRERIAIYTIEEALTSAQSFAADVQHYAFIWDNGSDPTLSFVARLPRSFPRGGKFGDMDIRRVSFSVEGQQDSQHKLVLRQNPILMDVDEDEKEHPLVLARNVKDFLVEFWDRNANEWVEKWDQTNDLPKMVKVTLQLASPNQQYGSSKAQDEITRIIALPSVMVPRALQMPNRRAGPGGPPPQLVPNPNVLGGTK